MIMCIFDYYSVLIKQKFRLSLVSNSVHASFLHADFLLLVLHLWQTVICFAHAASVYCLCGVQKIAVYILLPAGTLILISGKLTLKN